MQIRIPYGNQEIQLITNNHFNIDVYYPKAIAPTADQRRSVEQALNSMDASQILARFKECRSVAIAINDKTRPVPHQFLLPPLLQRLESKGISQRNIHFWIATGTHVPMEQSEFSKILPTEIIERYKISSHDITDLENLVFLGITSRGTPAWINKRFYQAEFKIVVGDIEPHHFAGFSGGVKSAVIGLGGRQTINKNHAMLVEPHAFIGEFDQNPLRQDIEELGRMAGIQFALNAVLNDKKEIVETLAGDPAAIMQTGIQLSRKICQVPVKQRYDVVIASPGGYPKDINLYQSQKALTHASILTKDGGTVILVAACPEGSGSNAYEEFMLGLKTIDDVFSKFARTEFTIGPHKAFQFARELRRIKVILVSGLEPHLVRNLLLTPAMNLEDALAIGLKDASVHPLVACLPFATSTIPFIQEESDHFGL